MIIGNALFVITSCSSESPSGKRAGGFNFPELAIPYYLLQDSGIAAELCTIRGGAPHPELSSFSKDDRKQNTYSVNRFLNDVEAMFKLQNALPVDKYSMEGYDALYVVGGEGAAHDIRSNAHFKALVQEACQRSLPVAAIGESASVLLGMRPENMPDLDDCGSFILGSGPISSHEVGERIRNSILASKNLTEFDGIDVGDGLVKTLRI